MKYGTLHLLLAYVVGLVAGERYPSIMWSPYNPLFACDEPTINVKINDNIEFLCPYFDGGFYMPDFREMYENMYLVEREGFEKCNATVGTELMKCDSLNSGIKKNKMTFRTVGTSKMSLIFSEGKTYYLIGTGFRTKDNVDSLIGGSCNKTESKHPYRQYKLRLKIYVCTNEELAKGSCRICRSSSCYAEECGTSCTEWKEHSSLPALNYRSVSVTYKRTCELFSNAPQTEYRVEQKHCSFENCSRLLPANSSSCVLNETSKENAHKCSELHQSTCSSTCGFTVNFCHYVQTPCPNKTCSAWNRTAAIPSSDYEFVTLTFKRSCQNPSSLVKSEEYKQEKKENIMQCSDWKLFPKNHKQSCLQKSKDQNFEDIICAERHLQTCSSKYGFSVSYCKLIGGACPKKTCLDWERDAIIPDELYQSVSIQYNRRCNSPKNEVQVENKQKNCSIDCDEWILHSDTDQKCIVIPSPANDETAVNCKGLYRKICKVAGSGCGFSNVSFCEMKEIDCPNLPTPSTGESNSENKEGGNNMVKIVLIMAIFICFAIGVLLGGVVYRVHHKKNCLNPVMRNNQVKDKQNVGAKVNLAYQYSINEDSTNSIPRKSVYFSNDNAVEIK